MKNSIIIILTSIFILLFCACENKSNYDLNEFLISFNKNGGYDFKAADFTVTKETDYIYSVLTDNNTLLTLYANDNNEIIQCTVTTNKNENKNYYKLCNEVLRTITKSSSEDSQKNINKVRTLKKAEYNGWLLTEIKSEIGTVFLINRQTNELNTNNLPTLKEDIEKNEITRQTAVKVTENNTSTEY